MDYLDQIHLGKWEDVMYDIPACSVDLIVTSPPYNVNLGNNKHKKDKYDTYDDNMPYDQYLAWMTKLFYCCNWVLKPGGRLCVNIGDGANGQVPTHADFTNILVNVVKRGSWSAKGGRDNNGLNVDDIWQPFEMMTTIVWDKKQIGSSTAWGSFQSPVHPSFPTQFEFIIVVGKGTLRHEGDPKNITVSKKDFMRNSRALWSFPPETKMMKEYGHPAMFPEELPRRLIQQLTYKDDVVMDPFSGAGTTCAVAKKLDRHYIGIEMSKKYHTRSLKRLDDTSTIKKKSVKTADGKVEEVATLDWME